MKVTRETRVEVNFDRSCPMRLNKLENPIPSTSTSKLKSIEDMEGFLISLRT